MLPLVLIFALWNFLPKKSGGLGIGAVGSSVFNFGKSMIFSKTRKHIPN